MQPLPHLTNSTDFIIQRSTLMILIFHNFSKLNIKDSNNSTNKMQVSQVYYLTFMCGSTCFGRLPAHHQELTTTLGASGFAIGAPRLEPCWSWAGRRSDALNMLSHA
jgi:hypothetical protein